MQSDVIVIGGGIAGLAAAQRLAAEGRRVKLLEAKDRLGGRACTEYPRGVGFPVELGAEFIHGGNAELAAAMQRGGLRRERTNPEIWRRQGDRFAPQRDYWTRIARLTERIPARTRSSFAAFLKKQRNLKPGERDLFLAYVESFNAAPAGRISAAALREEKGGAENYDYRPLQGYRSLVNRYIRELAKLHVDVRLNSPVSEVRWRRHGAEVRVKRATLDARAVVVTLPLGVLRARTVRFVPALRAKDKIIRRLGWGGVARITLRFDRSLWSGPLVPPELKENRRAAFGFINEPGLDFPTWWAPDPRETMLVGWSGGPRSEKLLRLSEKAFKDRAIASLAKLFRQPETRLHDQLRDYWHHNWTRDPFARGAYSYPVAGFESGPEKLAQPVAATLFFAGEATAGELGTVHGALASGIRAAEEVLGTE